MQNNNNSMKYLEKFMQLNNNKMVTAVEWLVEQISSSKYFYNLMEEIESRSTIVQPNVLQQAKAMEKEQIIDAYNKGEFNDGFVAVEDYYNETYGK